MPPVFLIFRAGRMIGQAMWAPRRPGVPSRQPEREPVRNATRREKKRRDRIAPSSDYRRRFWRRARSALMNMKMRLMEPAGFHAAHCEKRLRKEAIGSARQTSRLCRLLFRAGIRKSGLVRDYAQALWAKILLASSTMAESAGVVGSLTSSCGVIHKISPTSWFGRPSPDTHAPTKDAITYWRDN